MKKTNVSSVIMILVLSMASTFANVQANSLDFEMKEFGLGLHMQQFRISELDGIFVPANKVLLTINNNDKTRRIEPEIGLFYAKNTETDMSISGLHLGFGVFKMKQVSKTNIYYGVRLSYMRIKESNGFDYTFSTLGFGPGLGVEYFFSSHFSIGGEIGLRFMTASEDEYSDFFDEFVISTNTGLILRLYF